jgi:hypothetical protein
MPINRQALEFVPAHVTALSHILDVGNTGIVRKESSAYLHCLPQVKTGPECVITNVTTF